MDDKSLRDFNILLQAKPELARQNLINEMRVFLETYQKALQKREIEWLEEQALLEND